jgi:type IV secretion system protein VirB1
MSAPALTLAAFLELAAACAPGVAPETLAAIARTESGLRPTAVNVNGTGGGGRFPATAAEAAAIARQAVAAGRTADLGLMQVNTANLGWLGLTIEQALDPCTSVRAGAAVLTAYSRYNTGHPQRGFANGYVERVVASGRGLVATRNAESSATTTSRAVPAPCPLRAPPPEDVWGTARHAAACERIAARRTTTTASNTATPEGTTTR